jgi:hypothetical protein
LEEWASTGIGFKNLALPGRRWEDREIERKMISSGNERNIREIL